MSRSFFAAFVLAGLFLGLAALAADTPAPPLKTEHHGNDKYDFTLTTAVDGHLTLLAKSIGGRQLYSGPYTTPLERAEVSRQLRCEFRLLQVYDELLAQDANSSHAWAQLGPKAETVIRDQSYLEVDLNNELLVFAWPKLADPDNPLTAPAQRLAQALGPDSHTPDPELRKLYLDFRDARNKLLDKLAADQFSLAAYCTIRQEAVFIRAGLLTGNTHR